MNLQNDLEVIKADLKNVYDDLRAGKIGILKARTEAHICLYRMRAVHLQIRLLEIQ